ncbi:hypothetical protein AMAG_01659 [Allomyces macrogynus ATCC 38327]|uniref:Uncharacterized protein n=1 Tax=Allomyces macrogynus (strain ATCC 38327) TaxID=578462 RepID=A0A0L0S047_ALLM3|nr:hypothetical protein AMAG_01659 [Allomyces macrogynus ATCC 38327]|eukprot:KNE55785.1 hypothetical protein AMAG_01659 [Allomyces macrogynus ATCC 38327]
MAAPSRRPPLPPRRATVLATMDLDQVDYVHLPIVDALLARSLPPLPPKGTAQADRALPDEAVVVLDPPPADDDDQDNDTKNDQSGNDADAGAQPTTTTTDPADEAVRVASALLDHALDRRHSLRRMNSSLRRSAPALNTPLRTASEPAAVHLDTVTPATVAHTLGLASPPTLPAAHHPNTAPAKPPPLSAGAAAAMAERLRRLHDGRRPSDSEYSLSSLGPAAWPAQARHAPLHVLSEYHTVYGSPASPTTPHQLADSVSFTPDTEQDSVAELEGDDENSIMATPRTLDQQQQNDGENANNANSSNAAAATTAAAPLLHAPAPPSAQESELFHQALNLLVQAEQQHRANSLGTTSAAGNNDSFRTAAPSAEDGDGAVADQLDHEHLDLAMDVVANEPKESNDALADKDLDDLFDAVTLEHSGELEPPQSTDSPSEAPGKSAPPTAPGSPANHALFQQALGMLQLLTAAEKGAPVTVPFTTAADAQTGHESTMTVADEQGADEEGATGQEGEEPAAAAEPTDADANASASAMNQLPYLTLPMAPAVTADSLTRGSTEDQPAAAQDDSDDSDDDENAAPGVTVAPRHFLPFVGQSPAHTGSRSATPVQSEGLAAFGSLAMPQVVRPPPAFRHSVAVSASGPTVPVAYPRQAMSMYAGQPGSVHAQAPPQGQAQQQATSVPGGRSRTRCACSARRPWSPSRFTQARLHEAG